MPQKSEIIKSFQMNEFLENHSENNHTNSKMLQNIKNRLGLFWISIFLIQACGPEKEKTTTEDLLSQRAYFSIQAITKPITIGEDVQFTFEMLDSSKKMDSLVYSLNGELVGSSLNPGLMQQQFVCNSENKNTGTYTFKIEGFQKGNITETATQSFNLKSDIVPEFYTFEVIKTFPHDPQSFTQGLEWYEGKLWEGTGLNGKSAAMETDFQTGKAVQRIDLDNEYFGEGITIWNKQLFQITWQNRKGFVYSLPQLKKIREFSYPTDGWGLCHIGNELIMSDGSNSIYFYEPQDFKQKRKIEVWDNKNPVSSLNELEAVEGNIWANKYQTDTLVKIDPITGKVLAYADLSGILKDEDRKGEEDVLNGIAYNAEEKLYYVTGKNWPKVFAIRLVKRKSI